MERTPTSGQYWASIPWENRDETIPIPEVWFGSPGGEYQALEEELNDGEPCFIFTIAQFFLERITLEGYFDHLLGHLQIDGPRHRFDNARAGKIGELCRVDLIAAAIKSWTLSIGRSDEPLSEAGMFFCFVPCQHRKRS